MTAAPGTDCDYYVQCHSVWTCISCAQLLCQLPTLIVMPISWAAVSMSQPTGVCGDWMLMDSDVF